MNSEGVEPQVAAAVPSIHSLPEHWARIFTESRHINYISIFYLFREIHLEWSFKGSVSVLSGFGIGEKVI